jgi:DNA polymerase, archaea type
MSEPLPLASASDIALFGKDATARIVDVLPLLAGADQARVRVYRRTDDFSRVEEEDVSFYPFFFLSDAALLRDFPRVNFKCKPLDGDNFFRFLAVFESWQAYWDAIRHVERMTESREKRPDALYLVGSPAQQYFMQSGRTCFKGMAFENLQRMQLDIEVYSESGFPSAVRPEDRVVIIALHDHTGWHCLIDGREMPEKAMLEELVRVIRARDPDVIEGHNIFAFDLPYLITRCERFGVSFAIGRDGSPPRTFSSSMRFAERSIDFTSFEVAGRHLVDTYFQVMSFDVVKRNMPSYGLKAAARYFGFAKNDRTYVEGSNIAKTWREDPARLLDYALDDVVETERLARHLSGSAFYLTQMLPMPYGQVARTGTAAKIEALFVREYLRQRYSLPKSEWGSQTVGGYTDVFITGAVRPIVYADVESLYPSIMLNYDIKPKSDKLELFPMLLQRLTDLRLDAKNQMQAAKSEEERSELDARQSSYKVLINSFYGNLGFSMALFNDFAEADRVATTGQEILRKIIQLIRQAGGKVVEVDTDGVLFVPPPGIQTEEQERAFVQHLSLEMPQGIRIAFDGRYRAMLSYKKKNYALLTYDDKLKFKGSSLVSRSIERFGRHFVREATRLLLENDIQGLHNAYLAVREQILKRDWMVEDFSRTESLKDTVQQYLEDVNAGKRARAAAYELAIASAEQTGVPARKGDRVTYYIIGQNANVTAFENCRPADAWDPSNPDENTAYYLRRLDEFASKFEPFFDEHGFRLIFSPEDLFGFSPEGIRVLSQERTPEELEDEIPF